MYTGQAWFTIEAATEITLKQPFCFCGDIAGLK